MTLVQALWSLVGKKAGGLPSMSESCWGGERESQGSCPAVESKVRSFLINGITRCLE